MTQLEFLYESQTILIQSNKEEKMRIALKKFFIKTRIDRNSIYFLYHQAWKHKLQPPSASLI